MLPGCKEGGAAMKASKFAPFMLRRGDGSTLSLDFTTMSSLDSRFTYTRNSIATFINSSGLVQQVTAAATNDPTKARFDYDPTTLAPRGLLLEGSVTNLLPRSEDMGTATFPGYGVRTNLNTTGWTGQSSPDGATTAVKLIPNTTSGLHYLGTGANTIVSGTTYTMSVFAKPSGYGVLGLVTTGPQTRASFNLAGNSSSGYGITNTRTITPYANGWYRVTMTWTASLTSTDVWLVVQNTEQDPATNWVGDNTNSMTVWGAQLEASSAATSYIPTGTSTVQRAADSCDITGTNFSSWWPANQSEFTVLWTGDITRSPATNQFLWLNRNSGSTSRSRGYVTTGSVIRANAVALYDFTASPATNATVNTVFKHALAVKTGNSAMYVNTGTTIGSETTTTALGSGFDADKIIFNPNADNFMHIRTLKFWPQRLPNATLNGLVT
jgi:hypothetical protein